MEGGPPGPTGSLMTGFQAHPEGKRRSTPVPIGSDSGRASGRRRFGAASRRRGEAREQNPGPGRPKAAKGGAAPRRGRRRAANGARRKERIHAGSIARTGRLGRRFFHRFLLPDRFSAPECLRPTRRVRRLQSKPSPCLRLLSLRKMVT